MNTSTDIPQIVRALLDSGFTQKSLAEEIGVEQSTISRWLKGAKPDLSHYGQLAELAARQQLMDSGYSATLQPTPSNSIPEIDIVAGLGGGGYVAIEVKSRNGITFAKEAVRDHWQLPDWMLSRMGVSPRNVAAFRTQGDSMAPTIDDGDVVFVDTRHRVPSPPGVYALADEFGGVVVKRLEITSKPSDDMVTVRVSSDNPLHRERELTIDEINIVGRYIGRFTI